MPYEIIYLITGFIGGLVRGLVGVSKSLAKPTKFKFRWKPFLLPMFVATLVGGLSGVIIDGDWKLSLLAGYAGTDLLENLYKVIFSQYLKSK